MPELLNVLGTLGGLGVSRDSSPIDPQFVQAVFQQDRPLGDDEGNLIMQLAEYRLRQLILGAVSDGLMFGGAFSFADTHAELAGQNAFYMNKGYWLVNRLPLISADSRNATGPSNDTRGKSDLDQALKIVLPAPPASGSRQDELFLEVWQTEVGSAAGGQGDETVYERGGVSNQTLTNAIANPSLNMELGRRVQLRWRVRVATSASSPAGQAAWGNILNNPAGYSYAALSWPFQTYRAGALSTDTVHDQGTQAGGAALGSVDGFSYAIHLATVNRSAGVTTIHAADIAAGPVIADLLLRVPQANIYPPLNLGESDLAPNDAMIYQGTLLAQGAAGPGIAYLPMDSVSVAASITIPSPGTGTNVWITRLELALARKPATTGSDVIVGWYADGGGRPGSLLGTITVPKEWLQDGQAIISIPLGLQAVYGTTYWWATWPAANVIMQTDTASNLVPTAGSAPGIVPASGWTATSRPYFAVYQGEAPPIRNIVRGGGNFYYAFGYDSLFNLTTIFEFQAATLNNPQTASLITISRDPASAAVTLIQQQNPALS